VDKAKEAVSRNDAELTQHMINLMSQNINPFRRDWTTFSGKGPHRNLETGAAYRGSNPCLLEMWTALRCYSYPLWLGASQAKKHNWIPRKGSKGCTIMMPVRITYDKRDQEGNVLKDDKGQPIKAGYMGFRYVKVFNVADITGVDEAAEEELQAKIKGSIGQTTPLDDFKKIETANTVLHAWKVPTRWTGERAFYSITDDEITMPSKDLFKTVEGMYATWAHEQVHSTGHKSRLNRDMSSERLKYAREELVAELGAFLICNRLQICSDEENHAAYLKSWIEVLKEGPEVLRHALSDASQAATMICPYEDQEVMDM
jgi:antirestriction protein ArdC